MTNLRYRLINYLILDCIVFVVALAVSISGDAFFLTRELLTY